MMRVQRKWYAWGVAVGGFAALGAGLWYAYAEGWLTIAASSLP